MALGNSQNGSPICLRIWTRGNHLAIKVNEDQRKGYHNWKKICHLWIFNDIIVLHLEAEAKRLRWLLKMLVEVNEDQRKDRHNGKRDFHLWIFNDVMVSH